VNVNETHLVIVDSQAKEVCKLLYLRREDDQLKVIFREDGEVEERLTKYDVDVTG
jgi:hypothetical protein